MKKLLLILVFTWSFSMVSQDSYDVITLNNGSVIVGKITEFNFNENLTIQTKDGYGFVFNVRDVKNIKKEPIEKQYKMVTPDRSIQNRTTPQPNQEGFSQNNFTTTPNYGNNFPASNSQSFAGNTVNNAARQNLQATSSYNNPNGIPQTNNYATQRPTQNQLSRQVPGYSNTANQIRQGNNYPNTQFSRNQGNEQYQSSSQRPYNSQLQGYPSQTPQTQSRNNYYASNTNLNPVVPQTVKPISNPDIFTNVDSYGSIKNRSSDLDCSRGFGNFYFTNKTRNNVLISIQKKQKDGYYSDYRELAIPQGSKGYFSNLKAGDYPFFVKIKNSIGNNQEEYTTLGRGNIRVETCKTEYLDIR
ncbi:hypothetical protein M0D21_04155 [Aquimarina sp. D1M17]|uniref:hypothetical protein n=1 Tax=Aquimarina acroporae TaxID=2937283 RepID=UPI0020BF988F|nr:hypothetical protein [Aquimarina acroporae]MCK8520743.1 hypothetical protein [Aquimarina acroporae]